MPYGYIDPVNRVRQQQAQCNLAHPPQYLQPPVTYQQAVQSPLTGLPQAQNEIISASRLGQRRGPSPEARIFWGMVGALIGYVIHKNWHRAWVRGVVTGLGAFLVTWIVTFIGACIVSTCVKPGDQADLGPILGWTALAGLAVALLSARAAIGRSPGSQEVNAISVSSSPGARRRTRRQGL